VVPHGTFRAQAICDSLALAEARDLTGPERPNGTRLTETSASAQLIEERTGLCELVRAKNDKRLRLRFVLTHDLKRDADLRDRPLSCCGIAAPLGQKREGRRPGGT
jgi:hypothetical protein